MNITIIDKAVNWYRTELNLKPGESLRFFVRYGGNSSIQSGFSLGVTKDQPQNIGGSTAAGGMNFFVEEQDLWYFDHHNLHVDFNEKENEPSFHYEKAAE